MDTPKGQGVKCPNGHVGYWKRECWEAVDPFDAGFDRQYELARQVGDARFGSECPHSETDGHRCLQCGRRVV